MITKDNIRFRGKHIDDLTPDELKDALLQALNRVAELENAQHALRLTQAGNGKKADGLQPPAQVS
jgi:hypothetical protein